MKKLWRKFKLWLIKKLGGQVCALKEPEIAYRCERPITICANATVDIRNLIGDMAYQDYMIREKIAFDIAKELLKRGLIEMETEDNLVYLIRRYKGVVMVYDTKGGAE